MVGDWNATQAVPIFAQGVPPITPCLVQPHRHSWIVDRYVSHKMRSKSVRALDSNTLHDLTCETHQLQSLADSCCAYAGSKETLELCLNFIQIDAMILQYYTEQCKLLKVSKDPSWPVVSMWLFNITCLSKQGYVTPNSSPRNAKTTLTSILSSSVSSTSKQFSI